MSVHRFTLHESSGPVSPRYQYELSVEVAGEAGGAGRVTVSLGRPASAGGSREGTAELDAAAFAALCRALDDGPWAFRDAVPEGPRRVGISVSTVTLQWPQRPAVEFRYTLNAIDDPPHAREHAVVEALRAVGRSVVGG